MRTRFSFNLESLRSLPPAPAGQRVTYHDSRLPFLKCRVSDSGHKTLLVSAKVNGRSVRRNVAVLRGPDMDPSMAEIRRRAMETYGELEKTVGRRPRPSSATFGQYVQIWARSADMMATTEQTRVSKVRTAEIHCSHLWGIRLSEITRADVRSVLTPLLEVGKNRTARQVRTIVNQVFALAMDDDALPEDHPVPLPRKIRIPRGRRERTLSRDELKRLLTALDEYKGRSDVEAANFRLQVLVALFTAQRRGNILSMRWDQLLDGTRTWRIPAADTKTRKDYVVAIHDDLRARLKTHRMFLEGRSLLGPWVFPSLQAPGEHMDCIKRAWKWLCDSADLRDFRFHDLRHTAATIAYEGTHDLRSVQLLLQHTDMRTTANVYVNGSTSLPQQRATSAVARYIASAMKSSSDATEDLERGENSNDIERRGAA